VTRLTQTIEDYSLAKSTEIGTWWTRTYKRYATHFSSVVPILSSTPCPRTVGFKAKFASKYQGQEFLSSPRLARVLVVALGDAAPLGIPDNGRWRWSQGQPPTVACPLPSYRRSGHRVSGFGGAPPANGFPCRGCFGASPSSAHGPPASMRFVD